MSEIRTVRMLRTERGSANGVVVREYAAGQVFDLPAELAEAFVEQMQAAEYVTAESAPETPEGATSGRRARRAAA